MSTRTIERTSVSASAMAMASLERSQEERELALLPATDKHFWRPDERQAGIIRDMVKGMAEEGITPDELAAVTKNKDNPRGRHSSNWGKLARGVYQGRDGSAMLGDFMKAFKVVWQRRQLSKAGATTFVQTTAYKAFKTLIAAADARTEPGGRRSMVFAVGESGMGKSKSVDQVIKEHGNGILIHGNEAWRYTYKALLHDLCTKLNVPTCHTKKNGDAGRDKTIPELRRDLFADLAKNRRTLHFEEIDRDCLTSTLMRLWLAMVNETMTTVVISINPDAMDDLQRMGRTGKADSDDLSRLADVAKQILTRSRQQAFNVVEEIVPATLLEAVLGKGKVSEELTALLVDAGSKLGGYDLVSEVVQSLALMPEADRKDARAAVERALRAYYKRFAPGKASRAQGLQSAGKKVAA